MKNVKEVKEIEKLIEGNKFQETVHKINNLAYSILDEDIDCNFMYDIPTTFIIRDNIMELIDSGYEISKRSLLEIDELKEDTFYYWDFTNMETIKISEITKEKLFEVLDSIKEFLADYSLAV